MVTNQEIIVNSDKCSTRLEAFPLKLSLLYAPPPLRQMKDDLASAINLGIDGFSQYPMYVQTNDMKYANQGDQKLMECNRIMMHIADEWDDGLAKYKIKPSEIIP